LVLIIKGQGLNLIYVKGKEPLSIFFEFEEVNVKAQ